MDAKQNALAGLSTPAVLVDLDKVKQNIERFQNYADAHHLKVRPHIKTHKLPQIAMMQLQAGAIGITCQKVSEAEAMAAKMPTGTDILITYNIIGSEKLDHLASLAARAKVSVVADNATVVDGFRRGFQRRLCPSMFWSNAIPAPTAVASQHRSRLQNLRHASLRRQACGSRG